MASLFASAEAHAQSMDPTPERLVIQPLFPAGSPAGLTCQTLAANPSLLNGVKGAQPAGNYPCQADNIAFKNLVSELGFALAPSTMHPARTVGFGGFLISLEASFTHINANDTTHSGPAPGTAYWALGTQGSKDSSGNYTSSNTSPDSLIGVYSLIVKKGLPFGFELGGALGYVQDTSLWTVGADIRWALVEGFRTGALGYLPDVAVGGGVRTATGSSKMYLTTVGIDAELSKPFTAASMAVITPYVGFQELLIYGNSAVLDATPNVNAIQQCGYSGRNGATGQPQCTNTIPGSGGVTNDGDFNNNITFNSVQVHRERLFTGLTYRYELVYVGAQFLFEPFSPTNNDADLDPTRQWTISLQAGVFF